MDNIKVPFDVIIGHYTSDDYRIRNLQYVIDYYLKKTSEDTKIIIVEQYSELPSYMLNHPRIVYHKIQNPHVAYSRSMGFNTGVSLSDKNMWLLVDNDCIVSPVVMDNLHQLYKGGALIPYNDCVDLSEEETIYTIENNNVNGGTVRFGSNTCKGGSLFIDRYTFNRVGGYDPGFIGWGGEDDAFFHKLKMLSKVDRVNIGHNLPMFHMYHPKAHDASFVESETYQGNLSLLRYITSLDLRDLVNYVSSITQ